MNVDKNVTFLIGNGFDLNVGLKTSFSDFYEAYTKENEKDSEVIKKFKEEILKNKANEWKTWADFEMGVGQQSELFYEETQERDFMECFNDFVVHFNKYLNEECKTIDWDALDSYCSKNFFDSILYFYGHIKSTSNYEVLNILEEPRVINFIQFNYTDIFNKLIEKSNFKKLIKEADYGIYELGESLQIHGHINGGYPTIGVNDKSQIKNERIKNDPNVCKMFIKQNYLNELQKRNININSHNTRALEIISKSKTICAFGVSIGETDKFWWEKIGEWLKSSGGTFVIFDISGSLDDGVSPILTLSKNVTVKNRKEEIIERFICLSRLDKQWLDENSNKIIVEFDTKMFSFKLPKKVN